MQALTDTKNNVLPLAGNTLETVRSMRLDADNLREETFQKLQDVALKREQSVRPSPPPQNAIPKWHSRRRRRGLHSVPLRLPVPHYPCLITRARWPMTTPCAAAEAPPPRATLIWQSNSTGKTNRMARVFGRVGLLGGWSRLSQVDVTVCNGSLLSQAAAPPSDLELTPSAFAPPLLPLAANVALTTSLIIGRAMALRP